MYLEMLQGTFSQKQVILFSKSHPKLHANVPVTIISHTFLPPTHCPNCGMFQNQQPSTLGALSHHLLLIQFFSNNKFANYSNRSSQSGIVFIIIIILLAQPRRVQSATREYLCTTSISYLFCYYLRLLNVHSPFVFHFFQLYRTMV